MVYVIGVTGGVATGKTTVSKLLEGIMKKAKYKVELIDTNKLVNKAYEINTPSYHCIVERFSGIKNENDDKIDRGKLDGIIYSDPEEMKALEEIIWPVVRSYIEKAIDVFNVIEEQNEPIMVILEATVMVEAGWDDLIDSLWVTFVPISTARSRLMIRSHLSVEDADNRIDVQSQANELSMVKASVVIDNSADQKQTYSIIKEKSWNLLSSISPYFRYLNMGYDSDSSTNSRSSSVSGNDFYLDQHEDAEARMRSLSRVDEGNEAEKSAGDLASLAQNTIFKNDSVVSTKKDETVFKITSIDTSDF